MTSGIVAGVSATWSQLVWLALQRRRAAIATSESCQHAAASDDNIVDMNLIVSALDHTVSRVVAREWVAQDAGEALRCCLRDSRVGERVALVSVTPPGPAGAYAECGPVFVHADPCGGPERAGYPDEWRNRTQIFRSYDVEGRICGGEIVQPGNQQEVAAERLLADPDVAFLHSHNVVYGCYMLAIRRA